MESRREIGKPIESWMLIQVDEDGVRWQTTQVLLDHLDDGRWQIVHIAWPRREHVVTARHYETAGAAWDVLDQLGTAGAEAGTWYKSVWVKGTRPQLDQAPTW